MNCKTLTIGAALALLAWGPLTAGPVTGTQVTQRTATVLERIHWTNDLAQLEARAAKEKKLVFWIQLVGDLDGGL